MSKNPINRRLGMMLGRLTSSPQGGAVQMFPVDQWQEECALLAKLGFGVAEWIFDEHSAEKNPLLFDEGRSQLAHCLQLNPITVDYVMGQFFLKNRLFGLDQDPLAENIRTFEELLSCAMKAGIRTVELPLLEEADLTSQQDYSNFISVMKKEVLPRLEKYQRQLSLEVCLKAEDCARLFREIEHPLVGVTLDVGNYASLGLNLADFIAWAGKRLMNVHIKDRSYGGTSVALGEGDVEFKAVFDLLDKQGYTGNFIFECYMGENSASQEERMQRARRYLDFILPFLQERICNETI